MKKMYVLAMMIVLGTVCAPAQKSAVFVDDGVAIHGYDAVAYFTQSKPVKGESKFSFKWNGANWYFASQQDLDLFKANPAKYAPQYGGYCAYGVSQEHKAPTKPEAWTIVNGKLYLNYNNDVRATWQKGQSSYIIKADENWAGIKDKE